MQSPLPFVLLVIIAIATAVSGFLGFKLGDEALKGVSQPEINPSQKILDKPTKSLVKSDKTITNFQPINENKVVNQVKNYIASREKKIKAPSSSKKVTSNSDQTKTQADSTKNKPSNQDN